MAVVTISATYGAGGSELGPHIARRLSARFVDRAVPVAVAAELGITVDEADAVASKPTSRLWEVFARMSPTVGVPGDSDNFTGDRDLVAHTADHIRQLADEGPCVVLGHAGAIVLADRPDALHVRLDGSVKGRIQAAMHQHGISEHEATEAQKRNDKLRSGYVKHFYDADAADPALYHLVLDSVRLGWDAVEQLVVAAAQLPRVAPAPVPSAG